MPRKIRLLLRAAFVVIAVALAFWVASTANDNTFLQNLIGRYGYFSVFLISLASGFNAAIPIPAPAFVPLFTEAGLKLWPLIGVMTLGLTIADLIGYYLGYIGRGIVEHRKTVENLIEITKGRRWAPAALVLVWASVVPFPNEVLVIPLGFLGYPFRFILPAVLIGNAVFNTLAAFGITILYY